MDEIEKCQIRLKNQFPQKPTFWRHSSSIAEVHLNPERGYFHNIEKLIPIKYDFPKIIKKKTFSFVFLNTLVYDGW